MEIRTTFSGVTRITSNPSRNGRFEEVYGDGQAGEQDLSWLRPTGVGVTFDIRQGSMCFRRELSGVDALMDMGVSLLVPAAEPPLAGT
jgi:hypothetical protein